MSGTRLSPIALNSDKNSSGHRLHGPVDQLCRWFYNQICFISVNQYLCPHLPPPPPSAPSGGGYPSGLHGADDQLCKWFYNGICFINLNQYSCPTSPPSPAASSGGVIHLVTLQSVWRLERMINCLNGFTMESDL